MQDEVRCANPAKIIDQHAATSAAAVSSKSDTNLGDWLAIQIRQAPVDYPIFARHEGERVTVHVL